MSNLFDSPALLRVVWIPPEGVPVNLGNVNVFNDAVVL